MNLTDAAVLAGAAVIMAVFIAAFFKRKKNGGCNGCSGCQGCPYHSDGKCEKESNNEK